MKITANDILEYIKKSSLCDNYDIGVFEFCPYHEHRRMDAFYYRCYDGESRGYEIKVNRQDFLKDNKFTEYLKYCHFFSFIAPKDLIKPEELPDNIGLIEIELHIRDKNGDWRKDEEQDDEPAKEYYFSHRIAKKCKRINIKIDDKYYILLLEGLLKKLQYNKNILK